MRRVGLVFALLSVLRCGDGTPPTAPRATATPVPAPPGVLIAGEWTGTIHYDVPGGISEAVTAMVTQREGEVEAQIQANRFRGRFSGTLSAKALTGYLTTRLDGVPYGGAARGTASATTVRITTDHLRYQDWTFAGNTIELSR